MSNAITTIEQTREFAFRDNRLPYPPDLADAFGIDNVRWRVLINSIFPSAKTVESIIMALTYCRARNLDIFKRVVHIVPMWSTATGGMIDTIWPGIAELRTTAFRTGQFAGIGAAECGPALEQKLGEKAIKFPEWCQITVYRLLGGVRCEFVSPKVWWLESYATAKRGELTPNEMWSRRPFGQIEKCAEAAALRRAFPEEIGNEYAAEEMEGQAIAIDGAREVRRAPPPPPPNVVAIEHKPSVAMDAVETAKPQPVAVATNGQRRAPPPPPPASKPAPAPQSAPQAAKTPSPVNDMPDLPKSSAIAVPFDWDAYRAALKEAPDSAAANLVYDHWVADRRPPLCPDDHDEADLILHEECQKFW